MSGDLPKKGIKRSTICNQSIKAVRCRYQEITNLRPAPGKSFILREGQCIRKGFYGQGLHRCTMCMCTWGWVRFGNQERRGNNASLGCFIIFRIIPVNKNQNENDYLNHKQWSGYNDDNLNRDNHRGRLLKRKQEIHSCETPVDALQQRPLPSSPSSSSWPLIIANSSSF